MNSQSVRASLRLLGLVAFFATMPIYSPNIVPLFSALTDSDLTGAFVWPFMIAVAVVSLVLSILPHNVLKGTFASHAPACVVVAYPLVTALFYLIMLGFLPSSMAVARLLGAISGVLFVPCSIILARSFALPSRERSCNGVHCCGLFRSIELVLDVSLCHSPCGAVYLALRDDSGFVFY